MKRTEKEAKPYQTFKDLEVYQVVREDEAYLPTQEIEPFRQEGWRVHKLINGYIRFLRRRASGDSPHVREVFYDDDLDDLFLDRFNSSSFQRFNG
jgi:hypothetical protein